MLPNTDSGARRRRRARDASFSLLYPLRQAATHGPLSRSLTGHDALAWRLRLAGLAPERTRPTLPAWLWLGFPPLMLIVTLSIRALDSSVYSTWIDGERGLIELATLLLSAVGALIGFRLFMRLRSSGKLCGTRSPFFLPA